MALARTPALLSIRQALTHAHVNSISHQVNVQSRLQSWLSRSLLASSISIPAISISIPGLLSDIWEGILKAVPKKKTSHMKKRHRQLAGKALKDVNAVNTCPGCGKPKKAHTLCPYCVAGKHRVPIMMRKKITLRDLEIKESWKQAAKEALK